MMNMTTPMWTMEEEISFTACESKMKKRNRKRRMKKGSRRRKKY
jgi:hypothetical protein|tara:strand:+ start:373 stop:504 length:132 start_codon:yes stop_codon:yes gene_type:complete